MRKINPRACYHSNLIPRHLAYLTLCPYPTYNKTNFSPVRPCDYVLELELGIMMQIVKLLEIQSLRE